MRVERFSYDLPPELIAQHPAAEREHARLMIVSSASETDPSGRYEHTSIGHLADAIAPGSLVVVNDTKVIRARILGTKEGSGGKAEVFLVRREPTSPGEEREREARAGFGAEPQAGDPRPRSGSRALEEREREARAGFGAEPQVWRAMARASKPMRPGARVVEGPLVIEFVGKAEDGLYQVRLSTRDAGTSVDDALERVARVPLPPYIKRDPSQDDEARYQTIFAREPGAVAAPTAGLHLTGRLLKQLESKGCEIASCTLHVGLGTFEPVKTDDLDDHPMHAEYFSVSRALATSIARARERGAPVVAIGTTVVRALESAADPARVGHVRPCAEETRILIQPGYTFRIVDRLLTNFHLPRSTLLALVSAFAGTERVLDAYRAAVRERYRFFSYGDAMLLTRATGVTQETHS